MISNEDFKVIAELDLEPIKVKLMHVESGEGWSLEKANSVEVDYRRFLYLMKMYPNEQAAPLMDVDIFWHYHILDTLKYAVDCQTVFGYFQHHFPYIGLRGEDDLKAHERMGARMQELYESTFGEPYLREREPSKAQAAGVDGQTAFSAVAAKTAFSAVAAKTAFSAVAAKTAFSAVAAKTAFSAVAAQGQTAFSAVAKPGQVAFSAVAQPAQVAFSAVAKPGQAAFSAVAAQGQTAFSAVAAQGQAADAGIPQLPAFYTERPRLTTA